MTMQEICAEHLGTHLSGVLSCICNVVAVSTVQHNATTDHGITGICHVGHQKRLDSRDFNRLMAKFWVMHSRIHMDTQKDNIPRDCRVKFQEILDLTRSSNVNSHYSRGSQNHGSDQRCKMQQALVDKIRIIFLVSEVMGTNKREHHSTTPGSMRDTISSTLHQCTHQPHH